LQAVTLNKTDDFLVVIKESKLQCVNKLYAKTKCLLQTYIIFKPQQLTIRIK